MDNSAWRPDDKEWLEQRKAEWRQVQSHLKLFKMYFRGEYLKHHKELFFYGRIDAEVEKVYGDDYFGWALPLFLWWYHPGPTEEAFQGIFDGQTEAKALTMSRDYLFLKFPGAAKFDTDYGMFGGREELMVKMLVPSFDPTEERLFVNSWRNNRESKYTLCLHPDLVARYCLNGILPHMLGYRKNPYAPGQYLWDHLCALVETVTDEPSLNRLRELAVKVLTSETDADFPTDNPTAVRLAKQLKERYEYRDFSEAMLIVWDEENAKLGVV